MINTVKDGVVVENWGSKISRHELQTSGSVVEPLDPVRVDKLKVTVSGLELATLD